jgi:hypothetical protein
MTTGIPIAKKIIIVLIGTRTTKREMAKHTVPIPRINNQRVMMSMSRDSTQYIVSMTIFNNHITNKSCDIAWGQWF